MRLKILLLILAGSLVLASFSSGAHRGGSTLVTPPWAHCLGLHKVTQFHLDIYSGYREKFEDPEGVFCVKLSSKDKPDTRRDDDELTVYGVNSGNGDIIYNKSLISIGIAGNPGDGPMQFGNPLALTGDKEGNLYVADTENDRVVVFGADGSFIESFGAELDGVSLFRPYAIAAITEGDEYLYYGDHFIILTDSLGGRIWKLSPDGKALGLVRRAAIGGSGSFGHVAIDYYGNIYVTDRDAGSIHKFDRHLSYLVAIGDPGSETGPHFDEPRGISIYRRFGQVFISERSGAQYFWIGTDVLRYAAENLVFDTVRRRCGVDVSFLLTECSAISLMLKDDRGENRFTIIASYMLPPGRFSRRIEVDCPAAADLAKCTLKLSLVAAPTYSSREYLSVERDSRILVSRVSDLPPAGSP
jgi:hypothetical protein